MPGHIALLKVPGHGRQAVRNLKRRLVAFAKPATDEFVLPQRPDFESTHCLLACVCRVLASLLSLYLGLCEFVRHRLESPLRKATAKGLASPPARRMGPVCNIIRDSRVAGEPLIRDPAVGEADSFPYSRMMLSITVSDAASVEAAVLD
jgi:hypothetical protein